ncbi:MAG: DUF2807 domain-containing protein [Sphingorhabdus sp.]
MAGLVRKARDAFAGLTALSALIISLALPQTAGAIERKLLVASFENIVVIGDMTVVVETGKSPSAKASGDKRLLDSLKLERTGNTLRVRLQDIINNDRNRPITEPVRLVLTTQHIRDITVSGNGQITVSEVKQPNTARILIAGGGSVSVGRLAADHFTADINGNGKIDIASGVVRDGRVTIIGAGEYQAARVQTRKLRLEHNGNASTAATVSEGTEIFNRGSGNITIGGEGTCFIKLAGTAVINCAKIDGQKGR